MATVSGLPGAGKSTLLSRLDTGTAAVFDTEQVAAALGRLLPGVPYATYRPLTHAIHVLRAAHALTGRGPVVVHMPRTRGSSRRALIILARLAGRSVHAILLQTTPAQAWEGQRQRGRVLSQRRFAAHVRVWDCLRDNLHQGWQGCRLQREGFSSAVWLTRSSAATVRRLEFR